MARTRSLLPRPARAAVATLAALAVLAAGLPAQADPDPDDDGRRAIAGGSVLTGDEVDLEDLVRQAGEPGEVGEVGEAPVDPVDPTADADQGPAEGRERTGVSADLAAALEEAGDAPVAVVIDLAGGADPESLARDAEAAGLRATEGRGAPASGAATDAAAIADAADTARADFVVSTLQEAGAPERERVGALLADLSAPDVRDLWIVNALATSLDADAVADVAAHPDVLAVRLDAEVSVEEPADDTPPRLPEWGLEAVQAPRTWGEWGIRGDGITIAVLDSGVQGDHPALAPTYRGRDGDHSDSWYVATGENYPEPGDGLGHGTHVAGSITGGAPGEIIGVAPRAEWIGVKILNDLGNGTESRILDGMQWVLAPGGDPAAAPDIANNSWGYTGGGMVAFTDAVSAWRSAGILPVFSAGNAGPLPGTLGSPGDYPHAFSVGATDDTDTIAVFSSRGPVTWEGREVLKPDVAAPGHQVRSAWPSDLHDGTGYRSISGTSMAAPHVSGVAALVLSAQPGLGVTQLENVLRRTTRTEEQMGSLPNPAYGTGIVDSYDAVTAAAHSGLVRGTVTGPDGPVAARVAVLDSDIVVTTDPTRGRYETFVPAGSAVLEVSAYGHDPERIEVEVEQGGTLTVDVALTGTPTAPLSGTVTSGGDPVGAARVSLVENPGIRTYTDSAGTYALDLPQGTHEIRVLATGRAAVTDTVTVAGPTTHDVVLAALPDSGVDLWPQYRGASDRRGLADSPVVGDRLERFWEASVSPVQFGSPVITEDSVYVASQNGTLSALSRADGAVRWQISTGGSQGGTPLVQDGVVYTATGSGTHLLAVRAVDGTEVWRADLGGEAALFGAPAFADDTVYLATGPTGSSSVRAFDAATGEPRWSTPVAEGVYFGPAVADGLAVVASQSTREVVALDAGTGAEVWTHTADQESLTMPTIADGAVYVGTSAEEFSTGTVLSLDAVTGEENWRVEDHGDTQGGGATIYDDLVIVPSHSHGSVAAYDRETGERVWHHFVGTAVTSSVAVTAGGVVVGGSQDARTWALDATDGSLLWEEEQGASVISSTAVAGGLVVVATRTGTIVAYTSNGVVSGTVSGPDGPVEADVRLEPDAAATVSDPGSGAYTITAPGGSYDLVARAYGYAEFREPVEVSPVAPVARDILLTPVADGAIAGTVSGPDGAPLAGVVVGLPGTPLAPVTTGADGTFGWDAVAAGTHDVEAVLPGYVTGRVEVEVDGGVTTTVDLTLERYDLAVVADHDGAITEVLTEAGWSADGVSFEQIEGTVGAYGAVVLGGSGTDRADADLPRLAAIVAEAEAAGVGVVALDQWAPSYGSVGPLLEALGEPGTLRTQHQNRGAVWLDDVVAHPVTDGLTPGERNPYLTGGAHAWLEGWEGQGLARIGNDRDGSLGPAIGYDRRDLGTPLILLTASASTPWAGPGLTWEDPAETVLTAAVTHALEAEFGAVDVQVTTPDGPLGSGRVVVAAGDTTESAPVVDGAARLLLQPGTHTLALDAVGYEAAQVDVEITGGQETSAVLTATPSATGALAGVVSDATSGDPVPGAQVTVLDAGVDPVEAGPDGTYVVSGVPEGTHTVSVTAEGFTETVVPDVVVAAGGTTSLDLDLLSTPRVAVLGEFSGDLTEFLAGQDVPATATDWSVVDDLDAVDVVILNNPPEVSRREFLAHLDAFDAAGVSVIVTATNSDFSSAGLGMLTEYVGDPAGWEPLGGFNRPPVTLTPVGEHPITAGLGTEPLDLVNSGAEAPWFVGAGGLVVGEVGEIGSAPVGPGIVVDVRTPDSVLVVLSGLASSVRNQPDTTWGEDGSALFLSTLRYAAAPDLTQVSGMVTDPEGAAIAGATVAVEGRRWAATADGDGAFLLGLPAGEHTLVVSAHGYEPQEVPVLADGSPQDLDVVLVPGAAAALTGTVTSAGDPGAGAWLPTDAGDPVAGADVRVVGTTLSTTTAEDGTWSLPLVEEGEQEVEVEADGHVRTRVPVTVDADGTVADVALRVTPTVGVIADSDSGSTTGRTAELLADWGYDPVSVGWADLEEIAALDLVVVNIDGPGNDPGRAGLDAFMDVVNRGAIPVVWLGNYNRGGIQYLDAHYGELGWGQGTTDGAVTGTVTQEHPLTVGLPETFEVTEPDRFHGWFTDYPGTTVATVASETGGDLGSLAATRPRTTATVDVLLGTAASSSYGAAGTRQSDALYYSPETTRLLVNALAFAEAGTHDQGAEVLGTVVDDAGAPVDALVTVVETGRTATARAGDGTFLLALDPGTWTVEVSRFGHATQQLEITVEAGESARPEVTLPVGPGTGFGGVVRTADGAPVGEAVVRVMDTELSVVTDAAGRYRIPHVPQGEWVLRVDAPDGVQARSRYVGVTAPDQPGEEVRVDVSLGAPASALVVADRNSGGIAPFLLEHGWSAEAISWADLAGIDLGDGATDVLVLNGSGSGPTEEVFTGALAAAAEHDVPVILPSQWGTGSIRYLSQYLGDPPEVDQGFRPDEIGFRVPAEHPVFAGFEAGEDITILANPGSNQQFGVFTGYSGEMIADTVAPLTGDVLGGGVGYRFASPSSVQVLLGNLAAGSYGAPETRWTLDGARVYLNALDWALVARLSQVEGTVTGPDGPIPGAEVDAGDGRTTTGADGTYRVGVTPGTVELTVTAPGYAPAQRSVEVGEGETVQVDVALEPLPGGSLEVRVQTPDGTGVAGADVALTGPDEAGATTDADGVALLPDLPVGEYAVVVEAAGYLTHEGGITVVEGPTTATITLTPIDVAVLGDADGGLTAFLLERDVAAEEVAWADLPAAATRYEVVVLNGGSPTPEELEAALEATDAAGASLLVSGTYGVDQGGLRLLEGVDPDIEVGGQGYGDGTLGLQPADPEHPLFAGLDTTAVLSPDGYYSWLSAHPGEALAGLVVDGEDVGAGVTFSSRGPEHGQLLLGFTAVTEHSGPGYGWNDTTGELVLRSIDWLRDLEVAAPGVPTLSAEEPLVGVGTLTVTGSAPGAASVRIERAGTVLAEVEPDGGGAFEAEVTLPHGRHRLVAVGSNAAGEAASRPLTVAVDLHAPTVSWTPADGTVVTGSTVVVAGRASDDLSGVASVTVQGEVVPVRNGRFTTEVPTVPGARCTRIVLEVEDAVGNGVRETRCVTWMPGADGATPPSMGRGALVAR